MSLTLESCDEFYKTDSNFQALKLPLQHSIKNLIKRENFLQCDMEIKDFEKFGDNFLGTLYEINIKGVTSEGDKEINIFVKEKIILRKLNAMNADKLYASEKFIYKEISKIFTSLQDQANVPPQERFKLAKAYDETNDDAMFLENLCKKGFKSYTKYEPITLKFIELGVQEVAKYHALSFVIENKMPDFFKDKIATLESPINFDDDWAEMMHNVCKGMGNLFDNEMKLKLESYASVLIENFPKYHKNKTNIRTLSHGDYKANNVMFREKSGEIQEIIAVDYQLADYGCPIRDLLFFIFSGTDREFRKKHLNELKELYFETLSGFLRYFDIDVEAVYPRSEFERLFTEWKDYGLMMTLYFGVVMFVPDTGFSFENLCYSDVKFFPDEKFHNTLRGLVDDFVEWGYL